MEEKQAGLKKVLRYVFIIILLGVYFWSYYLFSQNYQKMEISHERLEILLGQQSKLASQVKEELGLTKDALQMTAANLRNTEQYLGKVKEENKILHEKIKLLNQMTDLESEVDRLKQKNALLVNQMTSEPRAPADTAKKFKTIEEGRKILAEFLKKIKHIRGQIASLKKQEREQRIADFKEQDEMKVLLGNKGFVIRDGQLLPPEIPGPQSPHIKIDVRFVK